MGAEGNQFLLGGKMKVLAAIAACSIAIALSLAGGLVAQADTSRATERPHQVDVQVELSHGLRFSDATKQAAKFGETVKGYRYGTPNVVGEYFPTKALPLKKLLANFANTYGVEPAVTALIVSRPFDPSTTPPAGPTSVAAQGSPYSAPRMPADLSKKLNTNRPPQAASPSTGSGPRPAPSISSPYTFTNSVATIAGLPSQRSNVPNEVEVDPPLEQTTEHGHESWMAKATENRITLSSGTVTFSQRADWGSETSPENVPSHWGLEFEFDAYNNTGNTNLRPLCAINNEDYFIATDSYSWSAYIDSTDTWNATTLGFYKDTRIDDSCNKASFDIGIRYPQLIPDDGAGNHSITITMDAPVGNQASNQVASLIQMVDDYQCVAQPTWALSDCMGFQSGLNMISAPTGVSTFEKSLSLDRGWAAPNRCWWTTEYGTQVTPEQTCGDPSPSGLDASYVEPTSSGGFKIFASLDPWMPVLSAPYDAAELTSVPYAGEYPRATSPQVFDVRAFIAGDEVPITGDGWTASLPTSGSGLTLKHNQGAWYIGDGSANDFNAFLDDGKLSFSLHDPGVDGLAVADYDAIRLTDLSSTWLSTTLDNQLFNSQSCWGTSVDSATTAPDAPDESSTTWPWMVHEWTLDPDYDPIYRPHTFAMWNDGVADLAFDSGCEYTVTAALTVDSSAIISGGLTDWDFTEVSSNTTGLDDTGHSVAIGSWGTYNLSADLGTVEHLSRWDGDTWVPVVDSTVTEGDGGWVDLFYRTWEDHWECDGALCDYTPTSTDPVTSTIWLGLHDAPLGEYAQELREMSMNGGRVVFTVGGQQIALYIGAYNQGWGNSDPYSPSGGGCCDA